MNRILVGFDPKLYRPTKVYSLIDNSRKNKNILNWYVKASFQIVCIFYVKIEFKKKYVKT
jgi:GDP-D-mannose dehydratase